jgi:predicted RNA polymerase sigma factor
LQAPIAACHARARAAEDTDWERIVALWDYVEKVVRLGTQKPAP